MSRGPSVTLLEVTHHKTGPLMWLYKSHCSVSQPPTRPLGLLRVLNSEQSVLTPTWLSCAAVWVAHCIMYASLWLALFSSRTPSPNTAFFPHISLGGGGGGGEAVLGHRQVCVTHTGPPQLAAATLVTVFKRRPYFCHTGALAHPPELTPRK